VDLLKNISLASMAINDISLGTDIVEICRIKNLMEKFGDVFLQRIFNDDEIIHCRNMANAAESFAGRFAAKEAFAKALGTGIGGNFAWKDISIGKKQSGEPHVILSKSAENVLKKSGFSDVKVSISHTKILAQAVVVLIR
jgi:holo-[acyl-carrier protein] synthase